MVTEIIAVQTADFNGSQLQCVSAQELYDFLGARKRDFARWLNDVVMGNGIEGEDYILHNAPNAESSVCMLTIDFAKSISMMSKTEKGKLVRQYFIKVEKAYKTIVAPNNTPAVPMTYKEALKAHLETLEKMELQGQELQKANDHIALLQHTGKLFTATEIAKEMGLSSANELNRLLEEKQIQYKVNNTWVLRSWYADKGYTSIKQMEMENGKVIYDRKWTQAGRDFILKKLSQPVTKDLTTKIEE